MALNNPYAKYKTNAINTATPEELTLMLYEGALKFSNQAIVAIERREFLKANKLIQRVEDIIREFQITLKMDYDIAKDLNAMYDKIYEILVRANINKSLEDMNLATELIRGMRDTWKEAMKLSRQGN